MATVGELGHAKNVANFEDLISVCTGYGTPYNPSKAALKLPGLTATHTAAKNAATALITAETSFKNTTNARELAFEPLKRLTTKIVNALTATDAKPQTIADVKSLANLIQGKQQKTETPTTPPTEGEPITEEPKRVISTRKQSYDSYLDNFTKLIALLTAEPLYIPNENELKVATLNTLLTSLKTTNTNVINSTTTTNNARVARNKSLYDPTTGLVSIAAEAKAYVKSLFGASSPEYKLISKIKFTNYKI